MAKMLTPPFGTYALPPRREKLRRKSEQCSKSRWGRAMISRLRKKSLKDLPEPFDVEVAPFVKARLFPSENRCEKRAIAGVQIWDADERAALKSAVLNTNGRPFTFIDVGANVGLYALFVASYAKAAERDARILAIEPGEKTAARLSDNITASDAQVMIIRCAVSDAPGEGVLGGGEQNRGEARLLTNNQGETVKIDTLKAILDQEGFTQIDAMKVDIEGHDYKALNAFFNTASKTQFPRLLILEVGKAPNSPLIDLCVAHGYGLTGRHGLNAILTLKG